MMNRFKYILAFLFSLVVLNWACKKDPEIVEHFPGWHSFTQDNCPLGEFGVQGIAFDATGSVWISNLNTVFKYSNNLWQLIDPPNGDYCSITFNYGVGQGNYVWVGGCRGLARIEINTHATTIYNQLNSQLPGDVVTGIVVEKNTNDSVLWISTSGGLCRFNGTNWTVYDQTNAPLTAQEVYGVTIDHSHKIWICPKEHPIVTNDTTSYMALNTLDSTWQIFTETQTGFHLYGSRGMICDFSNNVWSANRGVDRWNGVEWNKLDYTNTELPDDVVKTIAMDSSGRIWMATFDNGIYRYDNGSWQVLNTANSGLSSDTVDVIATRPNGEVWIGTRYGIDVFKE